MNHVERPTEPTHFVPPNLDDERALASFRVPLQDLDSRHFAKRLRRTRPVGVDRDPVDGPDHPAGQRRRADPLVLEGHESKPRRQPREDAPAHLVDRKPLGEVDLDELDPTSRPMRQRGGERDPRPRPRRTRDRERKARRDEAVGQRLEGVPFRELGGLLVARDRKAPALARLYQRAFSLRTLTLWRMPIPSPMLMSDAPP